MKLLNLVLIFCVLVLLSTIIVTLVNVLKPTARSRDEHVYNPFPTVSPNNLPLENVSPGSCGSTPRTCDNGSCSSCGDGFACARVSAGQNISINGIKLKPGNWCLPKIDKPINCNPYTGVWTWKNGAWGCECLYPALYDNPSTGCVEQVACNGKGKLKAADGRVWDPLDAQNSETLKVDPFSVDEKGELVFSCACDAGSTSLPELPYICLQDPCQIPLGLRGSDNTLFDKEKMECNCGEGLVKIGGSGKYAGLCSTSNLICGEGYTYNTDTNTCNCSPPGNDTGATSVACRSELTDGTTGPICAGNPAGVTCANKCLNNPCNGGTCKTNPDGMDFTCNCTAIPGCKSRNLTDVEVPCYFGGKTCLSKCVSNGNIISRETTNRNGSTFKLFTTTPCCGTPVKNTYSTGSVFQPTQVTDTVCQGGPD